MSSPGFAVLLVIRLIMPRDQSRSHRIAHRHLDKERTILDLVTIAINNYVLSESHQYTKEPLHDGFWTGSKRLVEWITRRPRGMYAALGVEATTFLALVDELKSHSTLRCSRYVSAEEQVAIFLFICCGRESVRRTGEEFQRSLDTVSQ